MARENTLIKRAIWKGSKRSPNDCHYCGKAVTFGKATVDHKTPKSMGGATDAQNCVVACKWCNGDKGDMTEAQYNKFKQLKRRKAS